jgi:PKD repeat protein
VNDLTNSEKGTITVFAPCSISCAATGLPVSGVAPLAVEFTASGDTTGCSALIFYEWAFGDGATSTEQNPIHSYIVPAIYSWSVTLSVEGHPCGQSGTITVVEADQCTVLCETSVPAQGTINGLVTFNGSATAFNCNGPMDYLWSFGDGGTSTDQNPCHTYTIAGSFAWTMTVTVQGITCSKTGTVIVEPSIPGDCDGDGQVSIGEVQKAINMFLGTLAPVCGVDCSGDGSVSIGEVQKVVNAFLGVSASC